MRFLWKSIQKIGKTKYIIIVQVSGDICNALSNLTKN